MSSTAIIPRRHSVFPLHAARAASHACVPTLFTQSVRRVAFIEVMTAAVLVAAAACPAILLLIVAAGSAP
ncbi:hypothetical protein WME89_44595 [Sorangium sp. So ce321]|uniref:hypothetical protein n=1 Tax=Sorangium sp. So ce321 TaxID=3133300 RepID=UPI003F644198